MERVTKTFPKRHDFATWIRYRGAVPRTRAVDDVSFTVGQGELFGLLGENGAGKSTILQMLAGLTTADRGSVRVAGIDARTQGRALRARIGLCTAEERSFYFRLTARENLRFFGDLCGLHGSALDNRIETIARHVDLLGKLDNTFETFSSGMRQRLAIARALLPDPPVLLLDEPTRAVDPVHARDIRALVRSLVVEQGKTAVLCTNLLDEAWELCDRIAVINAGRITAIDVPAELVTRARRRRYAVTLDRIDERLIERTHAIVGVDSLAIERHPFGVRLLVDLDDGPRTLTEFLRVISANSISVEHVAPDEPSPFQIYADLAIAGAP